MDEIELLTGMRQVGKSGPFGASVSGGFIISKLQYTMILLEHDWPMLEQYSECIRGEGNTDAVRQANTWSYPSSLANVCVTQRECVIWTFATVNYFDIYIINIDLFMSIHVSYQLQIYKTNVLFVSELEWLINLKLLCISYTWTLVVCSLITILSKHQHKRICTGYNEMFWVYTL